MDEPARPDDPLAQPTRARLFALLGDLRRPVSTEELAELLKLHPNGIRVHLDRMLENGLVARQRKRQARGRPRDMWLISPEAPSGAGPPTAYAQLGRWLARALAAGGSSPRKLASLGRQIGHELAPEPGAAPEASLHAALAALGFQPRRESHHPRRLTYRLCNCPYREAARESPQVVCELHRGITRGLIDELGATSRLTSFVPHDPTRAGCLIEISGPIATEGLNRLEHASAGPPLGASAHGTQ